MIDLKAPPRRDFDIYIPTDISWALREPSDVLSDLYGAGYLPYSGAHGLHGVFYRGRSARIDLYEFALNSENRRIARKFDGRFQKVRVSDFRPTEDFYSFCISYFSQKHGENAMPRERLETIMDSGLITHVITYSENGRIVAYVLEIESADMAHYWFSFYDLSLTQQSLGMWLMLDSLRDAKERGLAHYYLGTVYGQNALYKTNFAPLEWWSEEGWSRDIKLLKESSR